MKQKLLNKNKFMLRGRTLKKGYDWWWHSFTGVNPVTHEEKSFFIEYFIINPSLSPNKVFLGQDHQGRPSYLMVKAGSWGKNKKQIHQFYPFDQIKIDTKKLNITGKDFSISEDRITGSIVNEDDNPSKMSDNGSMSWDLKINKVIPFDVGYGTSFILRRINAFKMYWHVQGMKSKYQGTITLDGVKYIVEEENSFGYSDKNWGVDFTSPWVWLSSWDIISKITNKRLMNTVFDIGGGKPNVFGIPLNRKLLINLVYENKKYEFNFSKFWTFVHTKFDCYEDENKVYWNITTKSFSNKLEVQIECDKADMLFVNYEDPNGRKNFSRLFNGGTGTGTLKLYQKNHLVDEMEVKHVGCEYGKYACEGDSYYKS